MAISPPCSPTKPKCTRAIDRPEADFRPAVKPEHRVFGEENRAGLRSTIQLSPWNGLIEDVITRFRLLCPVSILPGPQGERKFLQERSYLRPDVVKFGIEVRKRENEKRGNVSLYFVFTRLF